MFQTIKSSPGIGTFTQCNDPLAKRTFDYVKEWSVDSPYITNVFKVQVFKIDSANHHVDFLVKRCDGLNFQSRHTIKIYDKNINAPLQPNGFFTETGDTAFVLPYHVNFIGHDKKTFVITVKEVLPSFEVKYYCTKEVFIEW